MFVSLITAAGLGRRLGEDKARVDLDGQTAVERLAGAHRRAGASAIRVVRREGAAELPEAVAADEIVRVDNPREMIDSVRAGWAALLAHRSDCGRPDDERPDYEWVVFHPVDYPLSTDRVLHPLRAAMEAAPASTSILLPRCGDRVGHPIALRWALGVEVLDGAIESMRDVIRKDASRVDVVDVDEPWALRDVDEPADLHAARTYLARGSQLSVTGQMRQHRSRRRYLDMSVPRRQLEWILDSARSCSTSSLMQAYSVVVIAGDPDQKAKCAKLCSDQRQIHEAPVFLAVCADLHRIAAACEHHDADVQANSLEVFVTATVDASLFGQNIQLAAESEGLGACMIGAARNHPVELARLLNLPDRVYVVFGMTVGFPTDDPVPRDRLPRESAIHYGTYDSARTAADLKAADADMRSWARRTNARGAGYEGRKVNEERGWTDRMAKLWGTPNPSKGREHLGDELRQLGFGLQLPDRAAEAD